MFLFDNTNLRIPFSLLKKNYSKRIRVVLGIDNTKYISIFDEIKLFTMEYKAHTDIRNNVIKDFVQTALNHKYWIYEPAGKRWHTPEEFAALYIGGNLQLKDGWQEKFRIMNPQKGLAAAEIMVQDLNAKRNAFQQKVIDYYQNK